jgi:hypothetical protein
MGDAASHLSGADNANCFDRISHFNTNNCQV